MNRTPKSGELPRQFSAKDKVSNLQDTVPRAEVALESCNIRPSEEMERFPESKMLLRQFPAVPRVDGAPRINFAVDSCNIRQTSETERIPESKKLPRQLPEKDKAANLHGAVPRVELTPRIHFPMDSCHVKHSSEMGRIPELGTIPGKLPAMNKVLNLHGSMLREEVAQRIHFPFDSCNIRHSSEMQRSSEWKTPPGQFLGGVPRGEAAPSKVQKSQKLDPPVLAHGRKGKGSFQETAERMPEAAAFKTNDLRDEVGPSSFSGASHPPEPVDTDLMKTVYVTIDQDKPKSGCLVKSLSVKGPFLEDLSIRVPGTKPSTTVLLNVERTFEELNEIEASRSSSPFLVPRASQTSENAILPQDSEEKECVWDASLSPSANVSPHSSIDGTSVVTAMSVVNSCTSTYRSDGITSDGMLGMERNCESTKGSVMGDSLESAKTSISRASDSSGLSDESSWSSITGSANKPHKGNDPRWKAILAVRVRDGILGMSHFRLLKWLGGGDIGSVYLSELSGTRCYFAMKVMDKASLASRKKLTRAQTEREILQLLDHPFLPTLYAHFETDRFSYLVMEFCPGGDLHTLRQRQPGKYFSEYAARFYAAEVLLALEYLHMLGVVYRDLKPENVLVRDDGHIMLSDFDLSLRCAVSPTLIKTSSLESDSKRVGGAFCIQPACIEPSSVCIQPTCYIPRIFPHKSKKKSRKPWAEPGQMVSTLPELVAEPTAARSMSFVGTHEYLAPEIIKGEGHGSAVDWWTFGIFLHELLYGRTPFKGSGNRETLFNVVGQQLRFPESPTASYSSRDLIRGLLVKEPQHRLGVKRGATEIKQHPFFEGVNWALIRCSTPPEAPRPMEASLPARLGPPEGAGVPGVGSISKRMLGSDMKSGGKYLDFEFF